MKLMVIDGNSIINRAFYGIRMLTTREGLCTNAVYGFISILQRLLEEQAPEAVCVTFDLAAPTFRHISYEGYKAQRKGMPEELAQQMPVMKQVLDAMNIRRYELEGWEADDLIGTLCKKAEAEGWDCVIVTGDKDSFQLISERTHVLHVRTRMGQTETTEYTPELFREEYGFGPEGMIELKALMGDSSDNIPGVAGVGEKTALGLVRDFGSVEALYARLDAGDAGLKPGVTKKLLEGREMAALSKELATIRTDAPLEFAAGDALVLPVNEAELYELFTKLEFSRFIERFGLSAPEPEEYVGECVSETVESASRAAELLEAWQGKERVYLLCPPSLDAVAVYDGECMFFLSVYALGQDYNAIIRALFSDKIKKVSHDIKDLIRRLMEEGIRPSGFVYDTALAAYLAAPTDGSYSLEKLAMKYWSAVIPPEKDYTAAEAFAPLADTTAAIAALFSHTSALEGLCEETSKELEALGLEKLYYEVELPLATVLADMEHAGFLVDRGSLNAFGEMLAEAIEKLTASIYSYAEEEFNINSTKQLGHVLFDKLMLPHAKKTKTGYSTNIDVLEKLRGKHPIIEDIINYRQLTKLKSTYCDGLLKVIEDDGRIHTNFRMTVTATGRLSSTEPNLQNIPVRTELGAEIRKMFVAGEGNVLVDADYSQIELRILAHISGDETMREAFVSGADIHTATAAQVFNVPLGQVTPYMRSSAKAVNFGIVYGISDFSLAQDIGVTRAEAKSYMDSYLEKYHGVRNYMTEIVEKAREDGFVTTMMGRRREIPELKSTNFNTRSFGERVALNTPIQGTAADVIKLAMVRVHARLKAEGLRARLIMQVHDELIVEAPVDEAERVAALLTEEMQGVAELSVPLTAEAKCGSTWHSAK